MTLSGPDGEAGHVFQSGDSIEVRMDVTAKEKITDFVFGLGLFNADNVCVYGTNTNLEEFQPTEIDGNGVVTFKIDNSISSRARIDWTWRRTRPTAIRTTTIACSTRSA